MSSPGEQVLLRVYLQSADRSPLTPTYERIVQAARKHRLAGATVLQGIMGIGYHGLIKPSAWSFVQHVPVIVEIVDSPEQIVPFVRDSLDKIMVGGMLTLERAAVMMYRKRSQDQSLPHLGAILAHHCAWCATALPPGADYCPKCGMPADAASPYPPGHPAQGPATPQSGAMQLAAELKPLSTVPRLEPGAHMRVNENGILLRVFIGESDKFHHKPLFEAIVQKVRELGLAGATVLRGSEGFGAHSVVHKAGLLEMSTDLPVVIEVIDTEDKVRLLMPHLETMVTEGMITMEYVVILMYRHNGVHETRPATPDVPPPV